MERPKVHPLPVVFMLERSLCIGFLEAPIPKSGRLWFIHGAIHN